MKSLLIRLMPAALLCLALTACGGGGAVGQTPYDPETAAQALLDSGAFSDALDTVDQDTAAALYGIDADTITGSAVYTSLSAGAEEIAVLVLTDEDAAAAALDGLEARVADQKAVLESYQPDEVSKLDSAIVEQRGNSVLLAVAADAEKARACVPPKKVPGTGTFFQTFWAGAASKQQKQEGAPGPWNRLSASS